MAADAELEGLNFRPVFPRGLTDPDQLVVVYVSGSASSFRSYRTVIKMNIGPSPLAPAPAPTPTPSPVPTPTPTPTPAPTDPDAAGRRHSGALGVVPERVVHPGLLGG